VCDAHSCSRCRLERGGPEVVAAIAHRLAHGAGDGAHSDDVGAMIPPSTPSVAAGDVGGNGTPRRTRLVRIALDWDRTLCTTRGGGEPLIGKHALDEELCALLWQFPSACEIVTRNGHTAAIRAFLASSGAPADIRIHTVRKGQSKADYVLAGLSKRPWQRPGGRQGATPPSHSKGGRDEAGEMAAAAESDAEPAPSGEVEVACREAVKEAFEEEDEEEAVLFVDDTVAELVDGAIAADARVHRVLFVRALL
jgi:hypothetical protein